MTVVVGHGREQVEDHIRGSVSFCGDSLRPSEENPGEPVMRSNPTFSDNTGDAKDCTYTVVACADTPLLDEGFFQRCQNRWKEGVYRERWRPFVRTIQPVTGAL